MKKNKYSFTVLLILIIFLMAACSFNASVGNIIDNSGQMNEGRNEGSISNSGEGQNSNGNPAPVNSDSGGENSPLGNPEAGNSGSDVQEGETELPLIPSVHLGSGDDWFRPTNPADIQLASGNVQFFEFSAVW